MCTPARLLLVEDNVPDVELLRLALKQAAFDCSLDVIDNGGAALDSIRRLSQTLPCPYDLAVLDLNLPRNDGIEILEALRAAPAFSSLPVVILTSSSSPRELVRLQALRITAHITKPIDFDDFMKIGLVIRDIAARTAATGG